MALRFKRSSAHDFSENIYYLSYWLCPSCSFWTQRHSGPWFCTSSCCFCNQLPPNTHVFAILLSLGLCSNIRQVFHDHPWTRKCGPSLTQHSLSHWPCFIFFHFIFHYLMYTNSFLYVYLPPLEGKLHKGRAFALFFAAASELKERLACTRPSKVFVEYINPSLK